MGKPPLLTFKRKICTIFEQRITVIQLRNYYYYYYFYIWMNKKRKTPIPNIFPCGRMYVCKLVDAAVVSPCSQCSQTHVASLLTIQGGINAQLKLPAHWLVLAIFHLRTQYVLFTAPRDDVESAKQSPKSSGVIWLVWLCNLMVSWALLKADTWLYNMLDFW